MKLNMTRPERSELLQALKDHYDGIVLQREHAVRVMQLPWADKSRKDAANQSIEKMSKAIVRTQKLIERLEKL